MKNVLVIGKNGYIGSSIYAWLQKYPETVKADIIGSRDGQWKAADFSGYDAVVNAAGIAHIMHPTEDMKDLYFSVNRDMAVEIGEYAKAAGVKQFINFSSMNVYGNPPENVAAKTGEAPTNYYGQSKLEADQALEKLSCDSFCVASIRPPVVYGKGCKGNYNTISKAARKVPFFPTYRNRKSMIYIDNLCEFIRLLIEEGKGGIYLPQNREIISTSDLVREISKVHGHKIWFTGLGNWAVKPFAKRIGAFKKAFGDVCYEPELSADFDYQYCVVDFPTSIEQTEK